MDIPQTPSDRALMFVLTGLTNFACFPLLLLSYRRGAVFHAYIGLFTFLTSFMYHSQEALGIEQMYLTTAQWHKMDNVGSIMAWIMVVVNFMDNLEKNASGAYTSPIASRADYHMLYFGMFMTLIMQTKHPWDLENTLVPVLLFTFIAAVKVVFVRRPRIDFRYLRQGLPFFICAVYCFAKGLNEHEDYLRIHHGMWHLFSSIGIFYMWQSVDKMRPDPKLHITEFVESERFGLKNGILHMVSFGFVPLQLDHKVKSEA